MSTSDHTEEAPEPGAGGAAARRTQAQRTEATRRALIAAGRSEFGARGFAAVSTSEVAAAAGVTRGALYHHFTDKTDLFRSVYESVEAELTERIAARFEPGRDPVDLLVEGAELMLDACLEPELSRIVLADAPAVLGWEEWREIGARYGLGLIETVLSAGIEQGSIRAGASPRALAHGLLGSLDELALMVGRSPDPAAERADAGESVRLLLGALRP